MDFLKCKYIDGSFFCDSSDSDYLEVLSCVFDQGSSWTKTIQKELLTPTSKEIKGNKSGITINNDNVMIFFLFVKDPEEHTITIDRKELLDLINQWETFKANKAQEITFMLNDNDTITMEAKY